MNGLWFGMVAATVLLGFVFAYALTATWVVSTASYAVL